MRLAALVAVTLVGGCSKKSSSEPQGTLFEVTRNGDACRATRVDDRSVAPVPMECPGMWGDQPIQIEQRADGTCRATTDKRSTPCPLAPGVTMPTKRWKVVVLSDGACRFEPQPRSELVTAVPSYNAPCDRAAFADVQELARDDDGRCQKVDTRECDTRRCEPLPKVALPCPPR